MQACLDRARVAAQTDLPILILGESGAGKTILARAIHNSSSAGRRPVRLVQRRRAERFAPRQPAVRTRARCVHRRAQPRQGEVRAGRIRARCSSTKLPTSAPPPRARSSAPSSTGNSSGSARDAAARRRARACPRPIIRYRPRRRTLPPGSVLPDQRLHPDRAAAPRTAQRPADSARDRDRAGEPAPGQDRSSGSTGGGRSAPGITGRATCGSCPPSSTRRWRSRPGDVIGEEHLCWADDAAAVAAVRTRRRQRRATHAARGCSSAHPARCSTTWVATSAGRRASWACRGRRSIASCGRYLARLRLRPASVRDAGRLRLARGSSSCPRSGRA